MGRVIVAAAVAVVSAYVLGFRHGFEQARRVGLAALLRDRDR